MDYFDSVVVLEVLCKKKRMVGDRQIEMRPHANSNARQHVIECYQLLLSTKTVLKTSIVLCGSERRLGPYLGSCTALERLEGA